jgi:hypothetical protein
MAAGLFFGSLRQVASCGTGVIGMKEISEVADMLRAVNIWY